MKHLCLTVALAALAGAAQADDFDPSTARLVSRDTARADSYEFRSDAFTNSAQLRHRYDASPALTYRGSIDRERNVILNNDAGQQLRGQLDHSGSGYLRDDAGNEYRVR